MNVLRGKVGDIEVISYCFIFLVIIIFIMNKSSIELQVGVKALIKNKKGEVLMLRNNRKLYPNFKGDWSIPGGRIKSGTSIKKNLEREVREETGLKMIGEPELLAAQDILHVPGKHIVRLTYICSAEGKIRLSDEHIGYKWEKIEKLHQVEKMDILILEILDKVKEFVNRQRQKMA